MTPPRVEKDAEVLLELPSGGDRVAGRVLERQGDQLVIDGLEEPTPGIGSPVRVFFEAAGAFWVQGAVWAGEGEGSSLEIELQGTPERLEQRGPLRIQVSTESLRASLAGEACELVDLSEVAFSVRTRSRLAVGDVVEAVIHDRGEALPGRVRVQSRADLGQGWLRYGLCCLDGRLKTALAGVCLHAQRARIAESRRSRSGRD